MRRGSISSVLLVCGGGVQSILLLPLMARCIETIDLCIIYFIIIISNVYKDMSSWKKQKYYTNNKNQFTNYFSEKCVLTLFLKAPKGNNLISKSREFHNVGAAYINGLSKNELAHVLLIGGTHNKQGSNDARIRIVVLLTLSLIKSHTYSGAVLLTALCMFYVCCSELCGECLLCSGRC